VIAVCSAGACQNDAPEWQPITGPIFSINFLTTFFVVVILKNDLFSPLTHNPANHLYKPLYQALSNMALP